jgi:hypothetical protein
VSVRTTCLVSVNVDDELGRRCVTKKQTVFEGALEVAEYAVRSREMGFTGSCMWRQTCWTV